MLIFIRTRCFISTDICHSLQWPIRLGVTYSGWIWQVVVCQPLKSNCFDALDDVTIAGTLTIGTGVRRDSNLSVNTWINQMCKFWTYKISVLIGLSIFVIGAFSNSNEIQFMLTVKAKPICYLQLVDDYRRGSKLT